MTENHWLFVVETAPQPEAYEAQSMLLSTGDILLFESIDGQWNIRIENLHPACLPARQRLRQKRRERPWSESNLADHRRGIGRNTRRRRCSQSKLLQRARRSYYPPPQTKPTSDSDPNYTTQSTPCWRAAKKPARSHLTTTATTTTATATTYHST